MSNPRSLSSMLGMAIRISKRMGIQSEESLAKRTPFEAEMCRRLWWALTLFDARIGEMANDKNTMISLSWDCRVPLKVNDSELWEDMKEAPEQSAAPSNAPDTLFVAIRAQMADISRRADFYQFFSPGAHTKETRPDRTGPELAILEKLVDEVQPRLASGNRLHFMTVWTTKIFLARCCLLEELRMAYGTPASATHDQERRLNMLILHALSMLDGDTKLCSSPLAKGFRWFNDMHFPFFAYMHIARVLRRYPLSTYADQAWGIMSANYEVRFSDLEAPFLRGPPKEIGPFSKIFAGIIAQTWEAREAALSRAGLEITKPKIVENVLGILARMGDTAYEQSGEWDGVGPSTAVEGLQPQMPTQSMEHGNGLMYYSQLQINPWAPMPPPYNSVQSSTQFSTDLNRLDWDTMNWA